MKITSSHREMVIFIHCHPDNVIYEYDYVIVYEYHQIFKFILMYLNEEMFLVESLMDS